VRKLAKSLSDRAVAVNLGLYSDTTKILRSRVRRSRPVIFDEYECWSNSKRFL
jgi:hypothetical protein